MSVTVDDERLRLMANAIDRAGTACIAVGIFAPVTHLGDARFPVAGLLTGLGGRLSSAIMLHLAAQWVLGGIR